MVKIIVFALAVVLFAQQGFSAAINEESFELSSEYASLMANESDIHFYLYTLENQEEGEELFIGDLDGLSSSNFVPGAPLKIHTHGYQTGCPHALMHANQAAWLKRGDPVNIICVDWKKLAAALYDVAAGHTRLVGQQAASLIGFLIEAGVTELPLIHVQGHSLGAHVAGFTGFYLIENGVGKLPVITALDPALPSFGDADPADRLDTSDADFVSVVHTAGGVIGIDRPIGHADFYPNGGKKQPGCGLDIGWVCSHLRAANLVIESVSKETIGFRSCKCDSYEHFQNGCACDETAQMGVFTSPDARGSYFLDTAGEEPFALG